MAPSQSMVLLSWLITITPLAQALRQAMPRETFAPTASEFLRRTGCPANTFPCDSSLGSAFNGICCENGQTCAFDSTNKPACCPSGLVCTGTAPATAQGSAPTGAISYVSNDYFSFPYAATSFDNRGQCSTAKRDCSENYDTCVSDLKNGGSDFAVTIAVPGGGGTTVGGFATSLGSSATDVCSSLSSEACSKLEATSCDSFDAESGVGKMGNPIWSVFALSLGLAVGIFG